MKAGKASPLASKPSYMSYDRSTSAFPNRIIAGWSCSIVQTYGAPPYPILIYPL